MVFPCLSIEPKEKVIFHFKPYTNQHSGQWTCAMQMETEVFMCYAFQCNMQLNRHKFPVVFVCEAEW